MQLSEFSAMLLTAKQEGGEAQITGIETDSRKVKPGDLFICLPGHTVDGHDYAQDAVDRGATALVVQRRLDAAVPQIVVKDSRLAMAVMAGLFYGNPSERMKLIGVTGTNGKTTVTYLVEKIMQGAGFPAGVIGTIERRYAGRTFPMSGTTPEALDLQRYLHDMAEAGTAYCAMEVSSHALEQGRVKGCHFRTVVFTNLTQDHLDYHGTMERYAAAKELLFARLGNTYPAEAERRSYAVLNADDGASASFTRATSAEVITYGVDREADIRASDIRITATGTSFHVATFRGETDITLRMVGKFNVYNALAALGAALIEGISLEAAKASLEAVPGVPGRVEAVDAGQSFAVVVDYAHTPDGLENVLKAVREFAARKVYCVFGCGGDRDRTKRPIMGRIAASYADYVIVTSDNPRTEEPHAILADIEAGLQADGVPAERYELIADRRAAIEKAVEMASPDDVVLIAGKGHETYQIIGKETFDFDDRLVAEQAIRRIHP
ncbi:UDP-N-acetylmuramoylalanyl-D-glutamate--2,6-diaminopimelate ligase [Paenibacillus darwinianus]|uniref:UDP-N-acetylmuramoyl-L-alanyl-D-glutamate--2,6-diaminopimelate ligase n=1 Tax=Paenibacillus darwinianus TaxID=1380763 RepID=A0A9W5S3K5_9BACL|nr:UDP-N-acetylmuramoyl-L-alanyl-D-glutamate--2,6-diaminopimelate ligase [Paenibacillus darwinianus]EXX91688.1 UDP-N-acetylmuramoylalanyl-D-glutamate--2,6-diaminopimelate ligase [Paenibacillus darwinianus]EXX92596.1 UDP-N-acetylmuramoylalanyl-D-glutamate--2,6-diaminopimelate ligase [Paenibacillus darwinianus]EXX92680.1 UDP-N-acetylmuramoylalanyl-D-glutamate--2,6-diaminopimelate ligase [Paenibacillus darwinianus]